LQQTPAVVPLGQKGDWVVMAAWPVQLRMRLLLPADPTAQQDAAAEAGQLRDRLVALQEIQARSTA
jgi:segregation and condensation protein A